MEFTWSDAMQFANDWQTPYLYCLIGYVPTVLFLQTMMKFMKPLPLEIPLKLWNCALSGLSLYGFAILFQRLFQVDFIHSVSSLDYSSGLTGYVVFLFNLSKIPEMVDTLFIVLRKKELTFLHVFHHLSVAIYCYSTLYYPPPLGYWYALMNTFVHGVMYGYFAFDKEIKRYTNFNPMYLTILQILQMAWGLSLNVVYLTLPTTQFDFITNYNAVYGISMYGSYLYLFCAFFAQKYKFKTPINWFMCFYVLAAHVLALFGFLRCTWMQFAQAVVMYQICGWGVTAGMHRLWSHRSYKARLPTRFILMMLASITNQGSIYHWCRDHRVHHKFSDTVADPHDINRGFFYAHMGWLLLNKDQPVKDAGKQLDCSDLLNDWVVYINYKLNPLWDQFWCFIVPGIYGHYYMGSFMDGFLIFGAMRWIMESHATWCVNSVAHTFGYRPYKDIPPSESLFTSLVANGEGWHNWHHAYPFDYAASEDGILLQWNHTKLLIDLLSLIGQTYDHKRHVLKPKVLTPIKEVPEELQTKLNRAINELDAKYKGQTKFARSMLSVFQDTVNSCAVVYTTIWLSQYVPTVVLYPVYSVVMGTVLTGLWVLGHECGHGAFGDNWFQNDFVGFILHSLLLVPYFPWKYSHNKHHKYTNHLILGDTHVPPLKRPYASLHKIMGDDAFAILDIVFRLSVGWPMYLISYATGGRTQSDLETKLDNKRGRSHFFSSSQVMKPSWKVEASTVGCLATVGLITHLGLWYWYLGPYLIVNAWLVLYTWLQHSHPDIPHYGSDDFSFLKGALSTVDRPYPYIVDILHHHIGTTHVLHHMNYSIPHFRAQEYSEAIKLVLGDFYLYDPMPIHKALFRTAKECVFVKSVYGTQLYQGSTNKDD
jgi:stearoyl-CoA desaturase (delta-9 desaturase)